MNLKNFKNLFLQIKKDLIVNKGGLKLKFIGFVVIVIVSTVFILSTIIINFMSDSIEKKAFEVAITSIKNIGDFSKSALLERSYENKINLSERIDEIFNAKVEGFLDISIYEHKKEDKKDRYLYLTGFKKYEKARYLENEDLVKKLNNMKDNEKLFVDDIEVIENGKKIEAYEFVKPIIYTFKKQNILLGLVILHYDKEAIKGVIRKIINSAIFITIFIVLLTVVIVYFFGSKFTKPILTISDAANEVANGDLNIELNIKSNDELGVLVNSFNSMVNKLREREKMEKFVSTSTIDMIQKDTKSDLILGGAYCNLTFLFSDIRGFTAMSETKTPEEVVEIVNFYLNLQSEIIKRNGGDIDKFVGDEIMASFRGKDALAHAVNCAIEIQNIIKEENINRNKLNKTVCKVGIGINSGEVIVGNVGSKERMDFTSIGSVVNLAARLCSFASEGEILIGEKILEELKGKYIFIKKEPIKVKGFTKPIQIASMKI